MTPIILASKSPRRAELMQQIGLPFTVCPADADESVTPELSPAEAVAEISKRKALAVRKMRDAGDVIVACDTVVALDHRIFGKPHTAEEAEAMLHLMSGRTHSVFSGLTVCCGTAVTSAVECTDVTFRTLSDAEITAYVKSGEPMDKAGAYGIQGLGAVLVERIAGDYFNVVGLPLCRLAQMLCPFGIRILKSVDC